MNDKLKKINYKISPTEEINIHEADLKLLRLIRSIDSGEIENIKVKKGVPVSYKAAWKKGKF